MLLAQLGLGETVQLSRVFSVDVLCGVACVVCYVSDIMYTRRRSLLSHGTRTFFFMDTYIRHTVFPNPVALNAANRLILCFFQD